MNFKKWVKSIQAAAYNGARKVFTYIAKRTGQEGNCLNPDFVPLNANPVPLKDLGLKPNFPKKPIIENELHAKSAKSSAQMDKLKKSIIIYYLCAGIGRFSMKSIFKSWFLGKFWIPQILAELEAKHVPCN